MKKIIKISAIVMAILVVLTIFASCGKASNDALRQPTDSDIVVNENSLGNGIFGNAGSSNKNEAIHDSAVESIKPESNSNSNSTQTESVSTNRKIIEKIYFSMQTKEFDKVVEKIEEEVNSFGGYIENSQVSGNSIDYEYDDYYSDTRKAYYTIRIPTAKSKNFSEKVSNLATVISKEISTEDVTLEYVDIESRIKALKIEKETLEKLLKQAVSIQDIIAIQNRLTDVISQIEAQESQLRTYDSLIEYTTFTITVYEVERVDVVGEQTMWEEIKTNLKANLEDMGKSIRNLIVQVVSSLPMLLIYAIFIIGIIIVIKKIKKKRKLKKEKKEQSKK